MTHHCGSHYHGGGCHGGNLPTPVTAGNDYYHDCSHGGGCRHSYLPPEFLNPPVPASRIPSDFVNPQQQQGVVGDPTVESKLDRIEQLVERLASKVADIEHKERN